MYARHAEKVLLNPTRSQNIAENTQESPRRRSISVLTVVRGLSLHKKYFEDRLVENNMFKKFMLWPLNVLQFFVCH